MKTLRVLALGNVLWLLASSPTQATPLYLTPTLPDLRATSLYMSNNTSHAFFFASGRTANYFDANGNDILQGTGSWGSYYLMARITPDGVLTNGSLEIRGDITGGGEQVLLTGNLKTGSSGPGGAFGFVDPPSANYDTLEFLFTVTGGTEASHFGNAGCMILDANFGALGFDGTWDGDFCNLMSGVGDVCPIPEPASGLLVLAGGALCLAVRRSRCADR